MYVVNFQIANIHCKDCVQTIERELSKLDGVISVAASLETKSVTIEYETPATIESIKKLLVSINYRVIG